MYRVHKRSYPGGSIEEGISVPKGWDRVGIAKVRSYTGVTMELHRSYYGAT